MMQSFKKPDMTQSEVAGILSKSLTSRVHLNHFKR
jgi:hypothetical protein